jgi:uncharacterized cofD-like protein
MQKVVVVGGGTGSYVLLSGLKHYSLTLTAIVPVTDDGGSTGRLRDEFGFLPVGDMRQCLAALAPKNSRLRQLLLYRFEKGAGLTGHNLGNLILTAMEDLVGSEPEAVAELAKTFRLKGRVVPVSRQLVKLAARYSSGKTLVSEHKIETHRLTRKETITALYTIPPAEINPAAKEALLEADRIILAPGDLYNSLIANLVIAGVKPVIKTAPAKLIYVMNLMTLNSQTAYFSAADHLRILEKYCGRKIDRVLVNNAPIPPAVLAAYQKQHEYPVTDDLGTDPRVVRQPLLSKKNFIKAASDQLKRSLLRHDPDKLAQAVCGLEF